VEVTMSDERDVPEIVKELWDLELNALTSALAPASSDKEDLEQIRETQRGHVLERILDRLFAEAIDRGMAEQEALAQIRGYPRV
jgi:hypothetical protein